MCGDADLSLGARVDGDATVFRLWTTRAQRCTVKLVDRGEHALSPRGDGVFEARVPGALAGVGYRFTLDGTELGDPWARWLPDGIDGPARVHVPSYEWRNPAATRALRDHVIYELHVGTFTAGGTYRAAIERLPSLVELGVTAIELMPLASFAGARGWGYDGVAHFAPHAAYGTPEELCALVDAAHGLGLSVFLDVVYNHFGPAGNVLPAYSERYFADTHTSWGVGPDFGNPWMRRYVLDNVRMWLDDYRFDGLRFDAIHAIADAGPSHILRDAAAIARSAGRPVLMMAEDDRRDPGVLEDLGFDAVWADDFHHAVHTTLTGEQDGYYADYPAGLATVADAVRRGWMPAQPAERLIYCVQNHDQIGNRAFGERLSALAPHDAYVAMSALLLVLPMTPLLFMGQEWAADSPFLYFTDHEPELGAKVSAGRRAEFQRFASFAGAEVPDPQDAMTAARSALDWSERAEPEHAAVLRAYRELIALRLTDPVLRTVERSGVSVEASADTLVAELASAAGRRRLVVKLGGDPIELAPGLTPLWTSRLATLFGG